MEPWRITGPLPLAPPACPADLGEAEPTGDPARGELPGTRSGRGGDAIGGRGDDPGGRGGSCPGALPPEPAVGNLGLTSCCGTHGPFARGADCAVVRTVSPLLGREGSLMRGGDEGGGGSGGGVTIPEAGVPRRWDSSTAVRLDSTGRGRGASRGGGGMLNCDRGDAS